MMANLEVYYGSQNREALLQGLRETDGSRVQRDLRCLDMYPLYRF